jgi:hypothetical protein
VRQLDDVAHAPCARETVVLERGVLRVPVANRVCHAALHRLRDLATLRLVPVGQHLCRLVGTRDRRCHDLAAILSAGSDVLGRHHDRGRAHQSLRAQPWNEAPDPLGILTRHLMDERSEAVVTGFARLVERVLRNHVRDRQEEQLRLGVTV